jgi:sRNA-binding protein
MPSTTLTVTNPEWQAVSESIGILQDLRDANGALRSATEAEFKQALAAVIKGWVRRAEKMQHDAQFVASSINPT